MKEKMELSNNPILYCDDCGMASPAELAKEPWTEEDAKKMTAIVEKIAAEFGLTAKSQEKPVSALAVAKYILGKQNPMGTYKLQKLCYYSQAWHYTWTGERLIKEEFQAWTDGPVCPNLFKSHKGDYLISASAFEYVDEDDLSADAKDSIDIVLEHYGKLSGDVLSALTHSESPWLNAREGLPAKAKCKKEITIESMGEYYRKHLI